MSLNETYKLEEDLTLSIDSNNSVIENVDDRKNRTMFRSPLFLVSINDSSFKTNDIPHKSTNQNLNEIVFKTHNKLNFCKKIDNFNAFDKNHDFGEKNTTLINLTESSSSRKLFDNHKNVPTEIKSINYKVSDINCPRKNYSMANDQKKFITQNLYKKNNIGVLIRKKSFEFNQLNNIVKNTHTSYSKQHLEDINFQSNTNNTFQIPTDKFSNGVPLNNTQKHTKKQILSDQEKNIIEIIEHKQIKNFKDFLFCLKITMENSNLKKSISQFSESNESLFNENPDKKNIDKHMSKKNTFYYNYMDHFSKKQKKDKKFHKTELFTTTYKKLDTKIPSGTLSNYRSDKIQTVNNNFMGMNKIFSKKYFEHSFYSGFEKRKNEDTLMCPTSSFLGEKTKFENSQSLNNDQSLTFDTFNGRSITESPIFTIINQNKNFLYKNNMFKNKNQFFEDTLRNKNFCDISSQGTIKGSLYFDLIDQEPKNMNSNMERFYSNHFLLNSKKDLKTENINKNYQKFEMEGERGINNTKYGIHYNVNHSISSEKKFYNEQSKKLTNHCSTSNSSNLKIHNDLLVHKICEEKLKNPQKIFEIDAKNLGSIFLGNSFTKDRIFPRFSNDDFKSKNLQDVSRKSYLFHGHSSTCNSLSSSTFAQKYENVIQYSKNDLNKKINCSQIYKLNTKNTNNDIIKKKQADEARYDLTLSNYESLYNFNHEKIKYVQINRKNYRDFEIKPSNDVSKIQNQYVTNQEISFNLQQNMNVNFLNQNQNSTPTSNFQKPNSIIKAFNEKWQNTTSNVSVHGSKFVSENKTNILKSVKNNISDSLLDNDKSEIIHKLKCFNINRNSSELDSELEKTLFNKNQNYIRQNTSSEIKKMANESHSEDTHLFMHFVRSLRNLAEKNNAFSTSNFENGGGAYECGFCNMKYIYKRCLSNHIRKKHYNMRK